jgi:L-lactate dehydrogenase complex protein LldG
MSAKANILAKIRAAQGRPAGAPSAAEHAAVDAYLGTHPQGPRPVVDGDLVARFRGHCEKLATTTEVIASMADAPRAAAAYLAAHQLPVHGVVWPALAQLDWAGAGLHLEARRAVSEDMVGITGAFCAIAETGTLMLLSGVDTPANTSLVPETHIALLPISRIVPGMEDGYDLMRSERGLPPRAVNFVSGPSRTADIEQKMVMGAHGPYRVHVILIEA